MTNSDIGKIFFPDSVVVCGVSATEGNLGAEIIRNLNRFAFVGRVYGVGRKAMEMEGREVYTDIADVPEVPDLAVLLVPAPAIPAYLGACGRRGVRRAVIETGGFSEFGPERKGLEEEIVRIAAEWGITFMGPNCLGVINMENGLCTPFVPFARDEMERGTNAFVSQSGGLVHELVRRAGFESVGIGKLASIGNKLMLDAAAVLDYLLSDGDTSAIGMYLEDARNGRRLMDLAAATEKPVVVLKGNRSGASRKIASFHTAALIGDDDVASAAFRQAGIHRVDTLSDMVDCFKIFGLPPMRGPNVVALSRSGGQAVVLADEANRHGFVLPDLPAGVAEHVGKEARAGVIRGTNPIDLGDVYNDIFYLEVVEAALSEASVDGVVFFYDYPFGDRTVFDMMRGLARLCRAMEKPVALCLVPEAADWPALKQAAAFPWFPGPERAYAALSRSLAQSRKAGRNGRPSYSSMGDGRSGAVRTEALARTLGVVGEYGLPLAPYRIVRSIAEGKEAARQIGYPVAVKAAEPLVLHKTEAGAVRLGITDDEGLEAAFSAMAADLYLVQAMAPAGLETIIGAKRDPEFGPVVMFGLGGVMVEVMGDVTCRVLPIDVAEAADMMAEIKGAPLFAGFRGSPAVDRQAVASALMAVSALMADHPEIESLDINPLAVFAEGKGCLALDVKMGVREGA